MFLFQHSCFHLILFGSTIFVLTRKSKKWYINYVDGSVIIIMVTCKIYCHSKIPTGLALSAQLSFFLVGGGGGGKKSGLVQLISVAFEHACP